MRFYKFLENDIVDCDNGICVSLWYYYCPHMCRGCHNKELWNKDCKEETSREEVLAELISLINKNGILRNLSILGGEPLADGNLEDTKYIIEKVKEVFPDIKIYLWTGYTIEELEKMDTKYILKNIDTLIEGRFILEKRDITLKLRGSSNQRIFKNINGKLVRYE